MRGFKIVVDYPYSTSTVWKALTDPALVPGWTSVGAGARPVGFDTKVGTQFQFVAKPVPGWDGVVECQVVECIDRSLLRYTWRSGAEAPQIVTCRLEGVDGGTRLTWEHTGFERFAGILMCAILKRVRKRMLREGLSAVLRDLGSDGDPLPGSKLEALLAAPRRG